MLAPMTDERHRRRASGQARTHQNPWDGPLSCGIANCSDDTEWCHDLYSDYLGKAPVSDPAGPTSGTSRNKRGGSYNYSVRDLRAARRSNGTPASHFAYVGFRVVRTRLAPAPDGSVTPMDAGPPADTAAAPRCGAIPAGKFILKGYAAPSMSTSLSYSRSTYASSVASTASSAGAIQELTTRY